MSDINIKYIRIDTNDAEKQRSTLNRCDSEDVATSVSSRSDILNRKRLCITLLIISLVPIAALSWTAIALSNSFDISSSKAILPLAHLLNLAPTRDGLFAFDASAYNSALMPTPQVPRKSAVSKIFHNHDCADYWISRGSLCPSLAEQWRTKTQTFDVVMLWTNGSNSELRKCREEASSQVYGETDGTVLFQVHRGDVARHFRSVIVLLTRCQN